VTGGAPLQAVDLAGCHRAALTGCADQQRGVAYWADCGEGHSALALLAAFHGTGSPSTRVECAFLAHLAWCLNEALIGKRRLRQCKFLKLEPLLQGRHGGGKEARADMERAAGARPEGGSDSDSENGSLHSNASAGFRLGFRHSSSSSGVNMQF